MKKIFTKNNIIRGLLLLVSTVIISLVLPNSDKFEYEYSLGKPWAYSLLTAPFDIPIELDSASINAKRDSIDAAFVDVYKVSSDVADRQVSKFSAHIDSILPTYGYRNKLIQLLRAVYDDGIVATDVYDKIKAGKMPQMKMIVGNVATSKGTAKIRSVKAAYEYIDSGSVTRIPISIVHSVSIANYLTPNVTVDGEMSQKLRNAAYQKALAPIGLLQKGERIIDRGDVVNVQTYTILNSYERMMAERDAGSSTRHYLLVGKILMVLILFVSIYSFLSLYRWKFFGDMRKMTFLMVLISVFSVMALIVAKHSLNGLYVVPFAMIPILLMTFFDSRTALYIHIHEVFLCALVATFPVEFVFLQFIAGAIAINTMKELSRRAQLMRTALIIFIGYCLTFVAFELIKEGTLEHINYKYFIYFAINAVLLSFSYILIFIIEKVFGFISTVTLVELSDVNNPLLRELSEECPGTFQHSLQVSNLAAEAARKIKANVQLVRTGALYHDIGKIENPAFFTENQHGVNPHMHIAPEQSAQIVISHVTDGVKRAEKAKLPGVIKDFITQHHGCGTAKYFYTTACNKSTDGEVDKAPFTYPGPNPQSKETSILMMADAVEAASRSLTEYTDASIRRLVDKIIDGQISDGMFKDSSLSFKDVEMIKTTFANRLKTIYHTRISYPELKK